MRADLAAALRPDHHPRDDDAVGLHGISLVPVAGQRLSESAISTDREQTRSDGEVTRPLQSNLLQERISQFECANGIDQFVGGAHAAHADRGKQEGRLAVERIRSLSSDGSNERRVSKTRASISGNGTNVQWDNTSITFKPTLR